MTKRRIIEEMTMLAPPARRVNLPELRVDSTLLDRARELKKEVGEPLTDEQLQEVYQVKEMGTVRRSIMMDLLLETYQDASVPPNSNITKKRVYGEFRELTGLSLESTGRIWKQCHKEIDKVIDIGVLSNYGATVLTDVIQRIYTDINTADENGDHIKDHVRLGYYKTLMEAADMLLNLGVKQKANDINVDKNKIMKQKVDNDAKLGAADVAIRITDMNRDDKERTAVEALFGDKTLLNPVFDKLSTLEVLDATFTES